MRWTTTKKFNFIYQTKNLINGKTYVGVHATNNLNDGYLGSGCRLLNSIKKHGRKNFVMIPMCFFNTIEEAYKEEAWVVNEDWVKSRDNYNVALGGGTGLSNFGESNPFYGKEHSEKTRRLLSKINTENSKKKPVRGINIKTGKSIYFNSMREAARDGFSRVGIWRNIKGITRQSKGYEWSEA